MAIDPTIEYGPLRNADTHARILARAKALMQATDIGFRFFDLDWLSAINPPGTFSNASSGGTHTRQITGTDGGVVQYSTSATAGSTTGFFSDVVLCSNAKTKPLYIGARAKLTTTPDAQAKSLFGFYDAVGSNKSLGFGVAGPLDTTNFRMIHDTTYAAMSAGTTSLGVAFDTSFHVFEGWTFGTTTFSGSMDYGAPVTATLSGTHQDLAFIFDARNGTTAGAQIWQLDWVAIGYGR